MSHYLVREIEDEDEALAQLRMHSQSEHQKLVVVAGQIIDEAVRRAPGAPSHRLTADLRSGLVDSELPKSDVYSC
jgi:hypothetical protein